MALRHLLAACLLCLPVLAAAEEAPTLTILDPLQGTTVALGGDAEKTVEVRVRVTGFTLRAAGQCGGEPRCGHLHLKIDPEGDSCNLPGRSYNSMNSDTGGDVIRARFDYCPSSTGPHVIGILLAQDDHKPVIVDGRPIVATAFVTTR
jgi:hypothetical protein